LIRFFRKALFDERLALFAVKIGYILYPIRDRTWLSLIARSVLLVSGGAMLFVSKTEEHQLSEAGDVGRQSTLTREGLGPAFFGIVFAC
jgi:hypothetical protein